jgi:hypothetical protein
MGQTGFLNADLGTNDLRLLIVGFEVPATVVMQTYVVWDITTYPYSLLEVN